MTRETRIGLLVGLLFIVMFGLVLGELTGTPSRAPAPAADEEDITAYAHSGIIEEYGWPSGRDAGGSRSSEASVQTDRPGRRGSANEGVVISHLTRPGPAERSGAVIETEVHRNPIALAASGRTDDSSPPPPDSDRRSARPPTQRVRTYKVQPNDSLIRIARKVYGRDKERSYRLIFEANRTILPDESTLMIGQELVIPPLPQVAAAAGRQTPVEDARPGGPSFGPAAGEPEPAGGRRYVEMDVEELNRRFSSGTGRSTPRRLYVVKRGDCLTKIAREVLHDDSPAAVRRLFNANRDRLHNPHRLPVGVELQIPS